MGLGAREQVPGLPCTHWTPPPPAASGSRTGDECSGRAGGAAKLLVPPSLVAMASKAGTASQRQSWGWHCGGTATPWIYRESPQPLVEGPAGIPAGDRSDSQDGGRCCLACTAPSSTQQHPRGGPGGALPCRSCWGPRLLALVHYRWLLSGCRSCRKRRHESAAMDFFLTEADPSGLLFITCSRRSYCSYSKSFYNDLSL